MSVGVTDIVLTDICAGQGVWQSKNGSSAHEREILNRRGKEFLQFLNSRSKCRS